MRGVKIHLGEIFIDFGRSVCRGEMNITVLYCPSPVTPAVAVVWRKAVYLWVYEFVHVHAQSIAVQKR
jgi:hypothetical protein